MNTPQSSMIYAIDANQQLLWYQHTGAGDGTDQWKTTPEPKGHVGTGWNFHQVFSGGGGVIYAIDDQRFLHWYRHDGYIDGIVDWTTSPDPKGYIGEGWNMKHAFSGGNGILYGVTQDNLLVWFRHVGFADGTDHWLTTPDPKGHIGNGWDMKHVFSGGDGVIYAVTQDNLLLWYRHLGFADGADRWQTTPDPKGHIGNGWDMKSVFCGGNGVIYAVTQDNMLHWFRHLGYQDGTDRWETSPDPKGHIGEGWGFAQVFGGDFAPRNIGLVPQFQETSEWCWIAVGAEIDLYYSPASRITQCALMTYIGQHINHFPASTNAFPTAAAVKAQPGIGDVLNHPYLKPALLALETPGFIDGQYLKSGGVGDALGANLAGPYLPSITLERLTAEITAGRPVAFDIQLTGPNVTHYVAVAGVLGDLLLVCDPGVGSSVIAFADFPSKYRGGAKINAVALTHAGPSAGAGNVGILPAPVRLH